MIIVYVLRVGGENADVSYNTAWQGLWAFAEISLGIVVTCTFSLPKFIEAKGTKLRGVLSSLTRPFTSLTSGGSFGSIMQSKKDTTASEEVTLDRVPMTGYSESDLPFTNHDHHLTRYPYDGIHNPTKYPIVNGAHTAHRFWSRRWCLEQLQCCRLIFKPFLIPEGNMGFSWMVNLVFARTKTSFRKCISVFVVLPYICFPGFFRVRLTTIGHGSSDIRCSQSLWCSNLYLK